MTMTKDELVGWIEERGIETVLERVSMDDLKMTTWDIQAFEQVKLQFELAQEYLYRFMR